MLYVKALLEGLDDMPPASKETRAMIDARMAERGSPALHAELARVDPVTAARLAPGDTQRIQRALEVWHTTGQPLSSFHSRTRRFQVIAFAAASRMERSMRLFYFPGRDILTDADAPRVFMATV